MIDFQEYNLDQSPNELAREILEMAINDQKARFSKSKEIVDIDTSNTKRMKGIINKYGFPTISLVGEDASFASWLLIQHADLDLSFQKKCLELMKKIPKGEIFLENIAFLEDRIRVAEGNPTLYGTQFYRKEDGKIYPREIEDEENVDERRSRMGLNTLKEHQKLFYSNCPEESIPKLN